MFVVSFSSKKFKRIAAVVASVIIIAGGLVIYSCFSKGKGDINNISANNTVEGSSGILTFISQFGWEVIKEPEDVREVMIPTEFDDVYNNYNSIQLAQGYNLEKYAGKRAKRWTFTITNYPGYQDRDCIKINVLVIDGEIIGGDVCSVELNGFMHGFTLEKE